MDREPRAPMPGIMSYEEYARLEHETPYVYSAESGKKSLTYFGAGHTHDPADPQFAEIARRFEAASPQLVLVEGIGSLAGKWEKIAEKLREREREDVARDLGEPWFALKLAADAGVQADSPEPSFQDEIVYAEAQGLSRDAMFAHYGYRIVDQYHRSGRTEPIEDYLLVHLEQIAEAANWEGYDFSAAALERVGRGFWGDRASLDVADEQRVDPVPWNPGERLWTDVNLAASVSSRCRDEFMVGRIAEALKAYDRLFVVFGATHAVMQEAAVRAAVESA